MAERSEIIAALGPTNTGKTHRALERMLEHRSGMMGLPLRLLAREVYDRATALVGENVVALVTGEEKRVPKRPRYFICTVEAMPVDRAVDFVAIDEIQLAGHRDRGHIFTDRLLHLRGRKETWFLGSDSMSELIERLVPTATFRRSPRLSTLKAEGPFTMGTLPPRSAVVAFSATRVYDLAERIKARRGGVAVVLGALSPRARNSQVAMYQAGEVDYLVATDAIGMGLNLDLHRVAFAETKKFDGSQVRQLDIGEIGQVAGRAGRYQTDGSFGTFAPARDFSAQVKFAIENHRFPAQRLLSWRNHDLSFDSIDDLLRSLHERSPLPQLQLVNFAEDTNALQQLSQHSEITRRARTPESVRVLWSVCQIPDYRKMLLHDHTQLLSEIFLRLSDHGHLSDDWLRANINRLKNHQGDIETLMARIAGCRTWSYISGQADWVENPAYFQEQTRSIEDELSDALHQGLVDRFVQRKRRLSFPPQESDARSVHRSDPKLKLAALKASMEESSLGPSFEERLVEAPHEELHITAEGKILFENTAVGRLFFGRRLTEPVTRVLYGRENTGVQRQIQRRLNAFSRDVVRDIWGPLADFDSQQLSPAGRGLVYQLKEGLGVATGREMKNQVKHLSETDCAKLEELRVNRGQRCTYVTDAFAPEALTRRGALTRAYFGFELPMIEEEDQVSVVSQDNVPRKAAISLGFLPLGPRWVRIDVVEQLLARGHRLAPEKVSSFICGSIKCSRRESEVIARLLRLAHSSPSTQRRSHRAARTRHRRSLSSRTTAHGHSKRTRSSQP